MQKLFFTEGRTGHTDPVKAEIDDRDEARSQGATAGVVKYLSLCFLDLIRNTIYPLRMIQRKYDCEHYSDCLNRHRWDDTQRSFCAGCVDYQKIEIRPEPGEIKGICGLLIEIFFKKKGVEDYSRYFL